jgi:MFS transporter, DHA1 family, tetracycline resistance protein
MRAYVLPILFVTLMLDMIGTGMVFPIIPVLFTDPSSPAFILHGYSTQAQLFIAGLIVSLFGLMQFIAAPILGELSDLYGRKRLLALGVGVLALSQLLFGFGIQAASLGILLVSRMIAGIAGGNFAIAQAAIADVTEPKDRAKNFGLIGAAFGIGFIIGPVLSGWIAVWASNAAAPFWFAAGLGILNLLSVMLFLPETRARQKIEHSFNILKGIHNIRAAFIDHDARSVYAASFLYVSGFSFMTSFLGVLMVTKFGFSEAEVGTFFGVVGACVVVTQLFILRYVAARFTERQILRITLLLLAAGIAAYPFMPSGLFLFLLIPFVAVPQGLSMANMTALVSKSVSADKQGAALGINGSLLALAQGVIPLAAGLGSSVIGIAAPFIAGGAVVLAAWYTLFVVHRVR